MQRVRVAAALACVGWHVAAVEGRLAEAGLDYFLVDDMQVPLEYSRHSSPLSAISFKTKASLWDQGKLNYVIETAATNPSSPADSFLADDDARISAAVAHWEANTCIRLTKCASEAVCVQPYLLFVSDAEHCNSPVGRRASGVNQINLATACSTGAVIHEIGHSLGLSHEQSRNDRDSFVAVDFTQIEEGFEHNFDQTGANGRDVGAYDYRSIMHYSSRSFAIGSLPTIVSPVAIGQRSGLSDGDVAGIQFLYNGCSDTFAAPKCIVSRDTTEVLLIPHSQDFLVEFNAEWDALSSMTVTYGSTTAPDTTFQVASGSNVGDCGSTQLTYNPSDADANSVFVLAATFTSTGIGAESTTCQIQVKVASSNQVCFGIAADDPNVCSGRGTCTSDKLSPCSCTGEYGGLQCQGYAVCPDNLEFTFDDITDLDWSNSMIDASLSAKGGSSAYFGSEVYGTYTVATPSRYTYISYRMARDLASPNDPVLQFFNATSQMCWQLTMQAGTLVFTSETSAFVSLTVETKKFYFVEHLIDYDTGTMSIRIDGMVQVEDFAVNAASNCLTSGVGGAVFFYEGWLDEVRMYCHSYLQMTGTLTEPDQSDLVSGGLTLTVVIEGDVDSWVDTEATKQALIDGFTADEVCVSPNGWNALKSTMMDTSLVTISGSTMTLGPLNAAASYSALLSTAISLVLQPSMVQSGSLPLGSDDQSFTIPGTCAGSTEYSFDDGLPSGLSAAAFGFSSTTFSEGTHSLEFLDTGFVAPMSVTAQGAAVRPDTVSYYVRHGDNTKYVGFEVESPDSASLQLLAGLESKLAVGFGSFQGSVAAISVDVWYFVSISFNWTARTVSVSIDGVADAGLANLALPSDFQSVNRVSAYTFSLPSFIDSVRVDIVGLAMQRVRVAAALACVGWHVAAVEGQPAEAGLDYFLVDDMQVPLEYSRHSSPLSAISFKTKASLWDQGKLNYVIETTATNPSSPAASFLADDDARISAAVAHWEANTCIRLTKCASEAVCVKPYLLFISDAQHCNSPVGRRASGVNQINLASGCSTGAVIHEIGHSLGLSHEQSRNDRDSFVAVDLTQIEAGYELNFDQTGANGRDIGAYDYRSIMHYSSRSFAIGSLPTIVSPVAIGQRSGLSDGDVAGIQFLYNGCSDTFAAPKCIVSRDTSEVLLIPHSQDFLVEFNAEWDALSSMTVTYGSTTAPDTTFQVASGSNVGDCGSTQLTYNPSAADANSVFVLAATFTSTGIGAESTTCQIQVKVASSNQVCFGIPADEPNVCSGRGTCTSDKLSPCSCTGEYGGLQCQGYAVCPDNLEFTFDDITDLDWSNSVIDASLSAKGGSSAYFGSEGYGTYTVATPSRYTYISYRMARDLASPNDPVLQFFNATSQMCWQTTMQAGTLVFTSETSAFVSLTVETKKFYFVEHLIDYDTGTMSIRIDGMVQVEDFAVNAASNCLTSGVGGAVFFYEGWLDEVRMYCHSYLQMTGTLTEPDQSDLVSGGLTLTVVIEGDVDSWVDTEATKQALIDGFTADEVCVSPNGWNALKSTMMDTSLVTISGSTMTLGPLNAAASFSALLSTVIPLVLKPSMVQSGTLPLGSDDQSFTIPGICAGSTEYSFDDGLPSGLSATAFGFNNTTFSEGTHSLEFLATGLVAPMSVTAQGAAVRPDTVSYYVRHGDNTKYVGFQVESPDSATVLQLLAGSGSKLAAGFGSLQSSTAAISVDVWYFVSISFDWTARTVSVSIDGNADAGLANLALPSDFQSVNRAPPTRAPPTRAPPTHAPPTNMPTVAPPTGAPVFNPFTLVPELPRVTQVPTAFPPLSFTPAPTTSVPTESPAVGQGGASPAPGGTEDPAQAALAPEEDSDEPPTAAIVAATAVAGVLAAGAVVGVVLVKTGVVAFGAAAAGGGAAAGGAGAGAGGAAAVQGAGVGQAVAAGDGAFLFDPRFDVIV
ncbi:Zinc metalloproteinase nas-39 [Diplonema papillatum]|nr:Zinc metalloproteinase nas-39 [Diplonema papillatum]